MLEKRVAIRYIRHWPESAGAGSFLGKEIADPQKTPSYIGRFDSLKTGEDFLRPNTAALTV